MRLATSQFTATTDKRTNLVTIAGLAANARDQRARLLVLPEASMYPLVTTSALLAAAEDADGPFVAHLVDLAARFDLLIVAGMFERIAGERRVYNTVVAVGPDGLLTTYRKMHLVDALGWQESAWVRPGEGDLGLFSVDGMTCGIATCYDLRFPEIFRYLALQGAGVMLVPAAWAAGPLKEEHWVTLLKARAIENTCYVAGAGQCGVDWSGRSLIADPMGVIMVEAGEAEGVMMADVTSDRLQSVRCRLPVLSQSRFGVELATQR